MDNNDRIVNELFRHKPYDLCNSKIPKDYTPPIKSFKEMKRWFRENASVFGLVIALIGMVA